MALPVQAVVKPSALGTYLNGQLPDSIMVVTSTRGMKLVEKASFAWEALKAAAAQANILLDATGMYRSYEQQVNLFLSRYTTTYLEGRPYKWWNGQKYYQKPGTAAAATPGTSNHGWGLAVDAAEQRDADPEAEGISEVALSWLLGGVAERYGWSWELQSEPWHIRYVAGDDLPAAVVEYLHSTVPPNTTPIPPVTPPPVQEVTYLINMPTIKQGSTDKNANFSLQGLLNIRNNAGLKVDGDFGPKTDAALRQYQGAVGLTPDGIAGPKTWNRIGY